MFNSLRALSLACAVGLLPLAASAQGTSVAFGGLKQDTTLPVKIDADQLTVNQADGSAIFTGNVLAAQGDMRLSAAVVVVQYTADGKAIERLHATGGVTLANLTEAAEAQEAVYTIASGLVVMTGDVLLTQGTSAISGQKLVIELESGIGTMEGRVQTVFVPATKPGTTP